MKPLSKLHKRGKMKRQHPRYHMQGNPQELSNGKAQTDAKNKVSNVLKRDFRSAGSKDKIAPSLS